MTIDELGADMVGLVPELARFVPPARLFDKHVYSRWTGSDLHQEARGAGIDTVIITGGETNVSSNFDTPAGGTRKFTVPFVRQA
jgi:nicotinamidase-related amidase